MQGMGGGLIWLWWRGRQHSLWGREAFPPVGNALSMDMGVGLDAVLAGPQQQVPGSFVRSRLCPCHEG